MCSNIKDNQVYTQMHLGVQRLLHHCSRRGLPFQHLPHLCTVNMLLNARMYLVMVEVLKRLCHGCSSLTSWNNIRGLDTDAASIHIRGSQSHNEGYS